MWKTNNIIVVTGRKVERFVRDWLYGHKFFQSYFKKWYDERWEMMGKDSWFNPRTGKTHYLPLSPDIRRRWALCNRKLGMGSIYWTTPEAGRIAEGIGNRIKNDEYFESIGM